MVGQVQSLPRHQHTSVAPFSATIAIGTIGSVAGAVYRVGIDSFELQKASSAGLAAAVGVFGAVILIKDWTSL